MSSILRGRAAQPAKVNHLASAQKLQKQNCQNCQLRAEPSKTVKQQKQSVRKDKARTGSK